VAGLESPQEGKIINVNYPGSIAERKMHFASSVEVIVNEKNELFNAVSIYVPMSQAAANIVDFDSAWVTAEKPAVMTCVVDNYKKIMKGSLLDQWMNVFRQDTNVDVILYLIVFLDDDSTVGMWEIDGVSIRFEPLARAFNKLFFISYVKVLFDENYAGRPIQLPADPGTPASAQITLSNPTGASLTVSAAQYLFNDGVKDWVIPIGENLTIPAGDSHTMQVFATTPGSDAALTSGVVSNGDISPAPPNDLVVTVGAVQQGTDPSSAPTEVPSKYFDLSLALAYLCKLDIKLSYFYSLVALNLPVQNLDTNACWIRSKTSAQEKEAMTSIMDGDREKYYWGALYLMECMNTWVVVHSEPVNIIVEILAAWFAQRNGSGQYVGNKLSLLRLSGTRIKPFGVPSWLNSEVNENDSEGFDLLDAKNVGYLCTIADNTPQDSCVSMARSVTGMPTSALMISKFVDYTSAQQCAKFITDKGTLIDPVLTDDDAYKKIQAIVDTQLRLFIATRRISGIVLKFPPFSTAKKGMTAIEAASSWSARYKDDLDEVTVTGGITAE
jgi:hypothetical protein